MVSEVVEHCHAVFNTHCFESALDAFELPESFGQRLLRNADPSADRDRCQRVAYVMHAEQRRLESSEQRSVAMYVEPREPVAMLNRGSTPRCRFIQPKGLDRADGSRHERLCMRTVGADEQ